MCTDERLFCFCSFVCIVGVSRVYKSFWFLLPSCGFGISCTNDHMHNDHDIDNNQYVLELGVGRIIR